MRKYPIHSYGIQTSPLILGCMNFGGAWNRNPVQKDDVLQMQEAIEVALEVGITMFDHADIYALGKAELVFGNVLRETPSIRDQMVIQSKLGIRFGEESSGVPTRYDFSREYILRSVDEILLRLGTEYLDTLLLHRPDILMDAEEVGETLQFLKQVGKVRFFGVSNMSAGQIQLLQRYCNEKLMINQLEMSLHKIGWLENGVHVNQLAARDNVFPEGTLEYCQLENIQLQAWGSLAQGLYSKKIFKNESKSVQKTAALVQKIAHEKDVSEEEVVLAWLLKHPANIQPIIGTTNTSRIRASINALQIQLTREEWYALYVSSRGIGLP